jgi:integrase/recombinase XerD
LNPTAHLKPVRCEKKQREYYTQTELEIIRVACLDDRDIALVEVLYSTGCRVSELCHLKRNDVNWDNNTVQLYGKGKKHRISYLNAKASVHLKRYLDGRTDNEDWLFLSKRGAHSMSPSGIQKILRDIYSRTDGSLKKKITPHMFRHTTATTAMQHGMPIEDIQALLGHENIETTTAYARTCDENVRINHKKYIM